MLAFQNIEKIFSLLKVKHYGQVTDELLAEGIRNLKDITKDGDADITNRCDFINHYLNNFKANRTDRLGAQYGENKNKLIEIKTWYATKHGIPYDPEVETRKEYSKNGRGTDFEILPKNSPDDTRQLVEENPKSQHHEENNSTEKSDMTNLTTEQRSREASKQLMKDNPNVVNLSDTNRPSKIAERFSEAYDNEWTEAFIYNSKIPGQDEASTIQLLLNIILTAYDKCFKTAEEDLKLIEKFIEKLQRSGKHDIDIEQLTNEENIVNTDLGYIRQQRKSTAHLAVNRLIRSFKEDQIKILEKTYNTPIESYADKCVELCWWMCVQDPPIHMCIPRVGIHGQPFTSTLYKPYTKSGKIMDFLVWPALLLYEDGPVLVKGVVQCK